MFRSIFSFVLLGSLLFSFSFVSAEALEPTRNPNYSQFWWNRLGQTRSVPSSAEVTTRSTPSIFRSSRYVPRTTSTPIRTTTRRTYRNTYARTNTSRGTQTYRSRAASTGGASIQIQTFSPTSAVSNSLADPVDLFNIGVHNNSNTSRNTLPEVYLLRKMEFQVLDKEGSFVSYSEFVLDINGTRHRFDRDGRVTVSFGSGNRITRGDSLDLDVKLILDEVDVLPRLGGGFTVRMTGASVISESSGSTVKTTLVGRSTTPFYTWNPFVGGSSGGPATVSARQQTLYGRTLGGGEVADVLAIELEAVDDDMLLDSLIVRDVLTGNSLDGLIEKIDVLDTRTGRVLDTAYFSGDAARFDFVPNIMIPRNSSVSLLFRVQVRHRNGSSSRSTNFKLGLNPADIEISSLSTGRDISNIFSAVEGEAFLISNGGSGAISTAFDQPRLTVVETPTPVYRFTVSNPTSDYMALGRITAQIGLSGLAFAGGMSTDDFKITAYDRGRDYIIGSTVSLPSSNQVRFDLDREYLIPERESRTFSISASLEDIAGGSQSVATLLLGDGVLSTGTLSAVRGTGANFVWSNHSATPHRETSDDWISGYQFNGLPTNASVIRD